MDAVALEISRLDLRYSHTRMQKAASVVALAGSIERSGQVRPVIAVASEPMPVLVDGYLRLAALRRCRKDIAMAEVWRCPEHEALIRVLADNQGRRWEPLEEAALIRELRDRHGVAQARIGELVGRDQSWVSRRLLLLESLSEEMLEAVRQGAISAWSASRVLAPMARAIPEHAGRLLENLRKAPLSTRELAELYRHYRKANRPVRQRMVDQPDLFIKSLHAGRRDAMARTLKEGPEGAWLRDLSTVTGILVRLRKNLRDVVYPGQSMRDRRAMRTALAGAFEAGRQASEAF